MLPIKFRFIFSDWLISKKSSPLKPLGQMNRNLIGSILGKSFIKIGNLDNYVNMKMTLNTYCQSFPRTFQGCFLSSFDSFGQAVSEETIF
jgi:hypothetical protein